MGTWRVGWAKPAIEQLLSGIIGGVAVCGFSEGSWKQVLPFPDNFVGAGMYQLDEKEPLGCGGVEQSEGIGGEREQDGRCMRRLGKRRTI